jgi:RNA polymerase sigma factor (sigma-70 family)
MAVGQRSGGVLGGIQRLLGHGTVSGLSEGQLLARFVGDRDEVAFEAIVSRHGPMVLGVCRRLLDDPHDVEDAFQATFLVLVRRAGSLRDRDLLANWLYGVALRVATRCRRDRTRRRIRERPEVEEGLAASTDEADLGELRPVIDVEVARLPERFRAPIVLCYFEGLTHDQAAERLGCPVGTVRSRMAKARELLRTRLARRGFGPASVIPAAPLVGISPAVPPVLLVRTTAAAAACGRSLLAGGASLSAVTLARGVLRAMTFTKWMTIAAGLLVLGAVGGGVRVAARQDGGGEAKGQAQVPKSEAASRPALKAIEELQSWINRYDTQLAARQSEIDRQHVEILDLKERIRVLEARIKADAARTTDSSPPLNPPKPAKADVPKAAAADGKPAFLDQIMTGPSSIVSISGSKDRVVIFAPASGRSRTYRPPPGMTGLSVTFHKDNVTIVANGPGVAHLANYNLGTDHWALQDLRGGTGHVNVLPDQGPAGPVFLLPCIFRGTGFTQLAILDFERATWTVQNLLEPSEESITPYVVEKLAMYVAGRHVYAYSAEAGRWDTLSLEDRLLPPLSPPRRLNGSPLWTEVGMFAVSQHGHLHVFTAKAGRWQTINPKD